VLRLKTRSQFQAVLAGSKLATSSHFAVHQLSSDTPTYHASFSEPNASDEGARVPASQVWLGAMIPKRWARRAVTRNAIKRQIYTVARNLESDLTQGAWVVRMRAGFDKMQFRSASSGALKDAVRSELLELLQLASKRGASISPQGLAK